MLITALILLVTVAGGLALYSNSGEAPGLNNNRLSNCPAKPNCVSSENNQANENFIEPIRVEQEQIPHAILAAKVSILELGGTIQNEQTHYISSTFSSKTFRFIDDVEIRLDTEQNYIHLRSASRVGYSDLGANRKRASALKDTIQSHLYKMTGTLRDQ